jgi:hypothetical protein
LKGDDHYSLNLKGRREYLKNDDASVSFKKLNRHFTSTIKVPKIREGEEKELETLIKEEALLFTKYLRSEEPYCNPSIAELAGVPSCE